MLPCPAVIRTRRFVRACAHTQARTHTNSGRSIYIYTHIHANQNILAPSGWKLLLVSGGGVCVSVCVSVCVCVLRAFGQGARLSAGVRLNGRQSHARGRAAPPPACLWVYGSIMSVCYCVSVCTCVRACVCVFRGVSRSVPCLHPHTVATRLATCSGIREHADYTRHNGDTQTQICPWPTKDTHTHIRRHVGRQTHKHTTVKP